LSVKYLRGRIRWCLPPAPSSAWISALPVALATSVEKLLGKGLVRLRELFSDKDYDVTERRSVVALQKGDILARLVPFGGNLIFSAAFCYHPREAIAVIKKEVKRRRKKEPERSPLELVYEAAKRAIKADRYRQIAVEKIYDFQSSKL
jgi:hypothetical protein